MDRGSVTSGAAFTTALRGTGVLLGILLVTGFLSFTYIQHHMMDDLKDRISEDFTVLDEINRDSGQAALIDTLAALRQPFGRALRSFGLFDRAGQHVAGDITALPAQSGWSQSAGAAAQGSPHLLLRRDTGAHILVIGRNIEDIAEKERQLILTLVAAGGILALSFLLIGYRSSASSLRKLDGIATVLAQVSQGDSAVRLHISPQNDQIDRVAVAINRNLDQLSNMIATTKASAAAIAHDLRTPLSRAFLAIDQAQMQADRGADPRDALDVASGELTRLRSIFDVILRISRISQESTPAAAQPLAPLLADLAETFAPVAEENGQSLTLHPVDPGLVIAADGAMISQMLANLLQNALNHCPSGTQIAFGAQGGAGGLHLWVADTGPGIPLAERDKVFALFYRLDPSRAGGGNGLGLALVKAIADQLGARITLTDAQPGLRVDIAFAP